MGVITGTVGGILRDIFINEIPLVFRKDIYALACVAGGVVFTVMYSVNANMFLTETMTAATVIAIRLLAVKFHWDMPIVKGE
jgi:uncharacterized membrane protein YeiH